MKSLAYMSLVHPVPEYGAVCWELYREGQINVVDFVQKKAAKFANHVNDSVWETLVQRRKLAFAPCSKHTPENGHGNLWGTS